MNSMKPGSCRYKFLGDWVGLVQTKLRDRPDAAHYCHGRSGFNLLPYCVVHQYALLLTLLVAGVSLFTSPTNKDAPPDLPVRESSETSAHIISFTAHQLVIHHQNHSSHQVVGVDALLGPITHLCVYNTLFPTRKLLYFLVGHQKPQPVPR
jgi:hypothetical protein